MDLLRSLMAEAFGRGLVSSVDIFEGTSSNVDALSRVGELAAEELWDVTSVR